MTTMLDPKPIQHPPLSEEPLSNAERFTQSVEPPTPSPSVFDPRVSLRPTSPPLIPPSIPIHVPSKQPPEPQTLKDFHLLEGSRRHSRLKSLFDLIPIRCPPVSNTTSTSEASTSSLPPYNSEKEEELQREENREIYARELWKKCSGGADKSFLADTIPLVGSPNSSSSSTSSTSSTYRWNAFEKYAEEKEMELWKLFVELDLDGDMRLNKEEVRLACKRAGVEVKEGTLDGFIRAVDRNGDGVISFDEWRDFLLLIPRKATLSEIFKYHNTHHRPSTSRLTPDGDVVVGGGKSGFDKMRNKAKAAEKSHQVAAEVKAQTNLRKAEAVNEARKWAEDLQEQSTRLDDGNEEEEEDDEYDREREEKNSHSMFVGCGKFLLAGGIAGAVSRTATAPFDRLKVYLITSPSQPKQFGPNFDGKQPRSNAGSIPAAVRALWKQGGGIQAFWTGNGLNVVKIFPESAIKFLSYESAKRVFAEYWDHVPDQTLISNSSRFVAGGIGGVVSQFVIYPIETLKTRVMSSTGGNLQGNALIVKTAHDMWKTGGIRLYFKGLTAGLIGVFPYSAIDMSTFEGIKLAYKKWSGEEPGIPGSLAFGALSGGIGATSVYPLNLIRTRLQAQGTPAHPQVYAGVRDAATRCYKLEGVRGYYKGLTPTLGKVIPAVSISYAIYEEVKLFLFTEPKRFRDQDSQES